MNIPLYLTASRIVAIPFVVVFYYFLPIYGHSVATVLFMIAALTDWLDGYLARKNHQVTRLGAFLDPVADKLLVVVTLVMIVSQRYYSFLVFPALIIVAREITISSLREWMSELGKRASVKVTCIAKFKTVVQMVALIVLLWYRPGQQRIVLWFGITMLFSAAALAVWSMIDYLKVAWSDLTFSGESQ